jgi:hypothetical protein
MTKRHAALAAILVGSMLRAPLDAHHSFSGTFDTSQPRQLEGTVERVEWRNPHTYVDLRVPSAAGTGATSWRVELSGAEVLSRNGWTATTLRSGMELRVNGFPDKSGSQRFSSTSVTIRATGETLSTPINFMPPGVAR